MADDLYNEEEGWSPQPNPGALPAWAAQPKPPVVDPTAGVSNPTSDFLAQLYGPRKDLNSAGPFTPQPGADPNEGQVRHLQGLYAQGKPQGTPSNNQNSFLGMMMNRGGLEASYPGVEATQAGAKAGMQSPDAAAGLAQDIHKARELSSTKGKAPSKSQSVAYDDGTQTLDMGKEKELGSVDKLKDIQRGVNDATMVNRMGEAFNTIGAGISRLQPSAAANKVFEENIGDAQKGVGQYKDQIAMQQSDPNSAISHGFRDFAKQFGVNIKGDFSAADGEKLLPYMFKAYEAKEAREARSEDLQYKMDSLAETRRQHDLTAGLLRQQNQLLQHEKMSNAAEKDYENELNQMKGKRGMLGDPLAKTRMADGLDAMLKSYPDLNSVPENLKNEFMSAYANMVTGGQASDIKFQKLVATTGVNNAAKFFQYLSNNPTGAEQGAFIKMFKDSAHHQADQAQAQIHDETIKHMKSWENRLPKSFMDQQLYNEGINPAHYNSWEPRSAQERAMLPDHDREILDTFISQNPNVKQSEAVKVLRSKGLIR